MKSKEVELIGKKLDNGQKFIDSEESIRDTRFEIQNGCYEVNDTADTTLLC